MGFVWNLWTVERVSVDKSFTSHCACAHMNGFVFQFWKIRCETPTPIDLPGHQSSGFMILLYDFYHKYLDFHRAVIQKCMLFYTYLPRANLSPLYQCTLSIDYPRQLRLIHLLPGFLRFGLILILECSQTHDCRENLMRIKI